MAEITWLGHSCFRLRAREATIVTDPYYKRLGYDYGKPRADIVTISRPGEAYNFVEAVKGEPKVLRGPGEYEINDVFITGISTYADAVNGKQRGKNTIYIFELEGMVFCHLGAIGHPPTSEQREQMSNVDVLMIPVGGHVTIDATHASDVISTIEPHVVIPMHYKTDLLDQDLDGIEKFAKEMGISDITPQERLNLRPSDLPEGTKVVILDYKNQFK
ncbi:MAG TPA: MBL fold metallo-hydrolase [Chloroflexia bacterium]|nr:MBL fold metallo-hydrolase [Chloroflexia bacterium]